MALQVNSDRLQRCSVDLNVQRACSQQRINQVWKIMSIDRCTIIPNGSTNIPCTVASLVCVCVCVCVCVLALTT